ncbi:hypothetical protein [Clostridium baratii]|uniref:hypothetical protein n=1 Tax=Clostridium baratii TaxID=1561 RepID=UPI00097FB5AD|nr:hypothetical protein [Clostridium baratii]AQM58542.1 hypothetical protein NPD11_3110 [Clostridium baratii]
MKKLIAIFLSCILGMTLFVGCAKETSASSRNTEKKEMTINDIVSKELKGTVEEDYDLLNINYNLSGFTENMQVKSALRDITKTLSELKDNNDFKKFKMVMFKGSGEFKDQYGNKKTLVALKNTFDVSEIEKVKNFDDITNEQLIALQGNYKTFCNNTFKKGLKEKTLKLLYPNT